MVDVSDDGDVAKVFDGHTKGGQSAPDLEKEVQHYTSNLTIGENLDFRTAEAPIQPAPRRCPSAG
jgi:hypothetical protein